MEYNLTPRVVCGVFKKRIVTKVLDNVTQHSEKINATTCSLVQLFLIMIETVLMTALFPE